MRFDKFTIKSQELVQNAQSLASEHHNQQIEPEHFLKAMLSAKQGVAGADQSSKRRRPGNSEGTASASASTESQHRAGSDAK